MKSSNIGGQAVMEGIMMMNGNDYAIAVRKPDGDIEVKKDTYLSMTKKHKVLGLPFVRGIFSFIDSMVVGMRAPSPGPAVFLRTTRRQSPVNLRRGWIRFSARSWRARS